MKQYTDIFFDLDHTLWDFAKNSKQTLKELYDLYLKDKYSLSFEPFFSTYYRINDAFWAAYRKGEIDKESLRNRRFHETLLQFGIDNQELSTQLGDYYVHHSPRKTNLFPHAHESLTYLKKKYRLHIITNGFEEVQFLKLERSKLSAYFEEVITSEQAGFKKPHAQIFEFAIELAKADKSKSLMIGDNLEADIIGARSVGIDQVFFNPEGVTHNQKVTAEIKELKELMGFL